MSNEHGSAPSSAAQRAIVGEPIVQATLRAATDAHAGTQQILTLLTAGQGEMDPLAAMIDRLEEIHSTVNAIATHLGIDPTAIADTI